MALAPLHKCNAAGCNLLTRERHCERHAKERTTQPENRANSYQRGYDKRWAKVRRQKLNEQPLCEDCGRDGRVKAADEVHHIAKVSERPDLRLDSDNLMCLCKECHSRRTARGE